VLVEESETLHFTLPHVHVHTLSEASSHLFTDLDRHHQISDLLWLDDL